MILSAEKTRHEECLSQTARYELELGKVYSGSELAQLGYRVPRLEELLPRHGEIPGFKPKIAHIEGHHEHYMGYLLTPLERKELSSLRNASYCIAYRFSPRSGLH